ncbi:hypothetical protein SNE25_26345 [Mucilaginibacter sabulilitoris]|uniref:WD40-like Beta Propeller Repeat n=1 Tax=Mucilaginibacter sabulilitoris TaxID=1173583 RepID=A0ABZ0TI46_9SPHI|nr:hypothetical protein [Mucilaginibacter sabulilitoris]WPU92849.1 hypothetical protein SNE25_26345 [Mucilaginibacter sabulilitoris]
MTRIRLYLLSVMLLPALLFGQGKKRLLIDSGATSQVFAPGILSTPYSEWSVSFSPDGTTAYSSLGDIYWTIISAKQVNGVWQKPEVVPFSGRFRDTDPFVAPDGSMLFFISSRPFLPGADQDTPQRVTHLWYAERTGNTWGNLHHLDSTINITGVDNYAPSVSQKGTLYYCSRRKGLEGMQSFYARWKSGRYEIPQQVMVPGAKEVQDPFIAPDESYLVYLDGNDICISFNRNGQWTPEEKFGPEVNNGNNNSSPHVSADNKTLYYTSDRVKGFYKRDLTKPALNYDQLVQENNSIYNNRGNILMIAIHLP